MVESSSTPVSTINAGGRGGPGGGGGARQVVQGFLKYTVDTPDLEKAKLHLTKRSVASGSFEAAAVPAGSTYTLGAEEADELGRRIPVNVKSPAEGGGSQEMTISVVVMEEEGAWKIDLPATVERMFGGAMGAMGEALGAMGKSMATAMSAVTNVVSAGLGGEAGGGEPSRMTEAAVAPLKKKAKAAVARAKKTIKKARAEVKKGVKMAARAVGRAMGKAKGQSKGKAKASRKKASKKAKPAKKPARKAAPAKKAQKSVKKKRR